jgi:hypothetical protein
MRFCSYIMMLVQWLSCLYIGLSYYEGFSNQFVVPPEFKNKSFGAKYLYFPTLNIFLLCVSYSIFWGMTALVDVDAESTPPFTNLERYLLVFQL